MSRSKPSVLRLARIGGFAAGLMAAALAAPLHAAESVIDAMAAAYLSNPTLQADRARQRATDEQVPQALSGWRPTVTVRVDGGLEWRGSRSENEGETLRSDSTTTPARVAINLSQPVFRGFRTLNETLRAEATVAAGQQNLLAVEQNVLLNAVAAHMNVLRDREIVTLRQRNVAGLREQLRGAEARFEVGEVTRTDVEQARARLNLAEGDLAVARANAAASAAFYEQITGRPPGTLTYPEPSPLVPASLEQALAFADRLNPQLLAAAFDADAARHQIGVAQSELLPSISLDAEFRASHEPSAGIDAAEQGVVLGVVQVPLYQAGRVSSQVREAKQRASQERIEIIEAGREVRREVVESWNVYVASGDTIASRRAQVAAFELALEGVRQEAQVGTRTTLDVLDAEFELVESQVALAQIRRDRIVASYRLVAATGRLTAPKLKLPVPYYDPDAHYLQSRDRIYGISVDTVD